MLSRRDLMGKLAVGAAGAAVALTGVSRASATATNRSRSRAGSTSSGDVNAATAASVPAIGATAVIDAGPTLGAPAPWELLRPLKEGSSLGYGWHVAGLTGVTDGSCVVTLQNQRGRSHRVHICRNGGAPQGLVYTRRFDLVVMNGGQGDLPTEEGLAQAVGEVAHVLAANESGWQPQDLVTALLPHAERVQLYSGALDRRLR